MSRKVSEDHVGTCQWCFGEFKCTTKKILVYHGFKKPGDGYLYEECDGVHHAPYEYDSALTAQRLQWQEDYLKGREAHYTALEAGEFTTLKNPYYDIEMKQHRRDPKRFVAPVEDHTEQHPDWQRTFDWHLDMAHKSVQNAIKGVAFFQDKVDNWSRQTIAGFDGPSTGTVRALKKAYEA